MEEQVKALTGKNIALLVANGFEEAEMTSLQKALIVAGAKVAIVSPEKGIVNSWHDGTWGHFFPVNAFLPEAMSHHFDGVVVPGGSRHVERLSNNPQTTRFLNGFMLDDKPVALHDAAALVANGGLADGRTVAATEDVSGALIREGAKVADEPVHVDGRLLSAFGEETMGQFVSELLSLLEGEAAKLGEAA
ncbi:DJ-1/PfpI family protein [Oceanibacterium hippocampi]|uniref:General stress protein 18 n=1 Tax=Oceanibacterium hippocampi TaxID=745714 RepID=A0A1Y5TYM3_9PROT|nr:DJ-1/PfpI family protein [Oceanibacterium hippocampi]SLN76820.1 General stress protein 18 [Oceanibacterium hippocampi]